VLIKAIYILNKYSKFIRDEDMIKIWRRKKWIVPVTVTCCLCCYILLIIHVFGNNEIVLGSGKPIDIRDVKPFEPVLDEDFPTISGRYPRIPKIIHQTWKDVLIPAAFHENVRSFVTLNPDFEYYFWTDASARELLVERYPDLLYTYDNYVEPVRKADLLR
jgi:hypothetical protein